MKANEQTIALRPPLVSEVDQALEAWRLKANTGRLWSADATLWTGSDEGDWLGWLDIAKNKLCHVEPLQDFAGEIRAE